jgi:hypothetical protein
MMRRGGMRWLIVVALIGCTVEEQEIELTDSVSIEMSKTLGCFDKTTAAGFEVSFYRAFVLADQGVRAGFHLDQVSFGSLAIGNAGSSQPVDINVYAYDGPTGGSSLDLVQRAPLASTMITVDNAPVASATPVLVDVPFSTVVEGTDALLVEIHARPGATFAGHLSIAANEQGETAPSYVRCSSGEVFTTQDASDDHRPHNAVIYAKGSRIPDLGDQPPVR